MKLEAEVQAMGKSRVGGGPAEKVGDISVKSGVIYCG